MNRLNALAKEAKINENASIRDQHSIIINAPIDKVFTILKNVEEWPSWNPEITKAKASGPITEGSTFEWTHNQQKLTAEVQLFEEPTTLTWTGKTKWVKDIFVWQLDKDENQTIVTVGASLQGAFVILVKNHQRVYNELLRWLECLKKAAEK
jgi:uncharacterized protein YndB with AHSA1/START domain